MTTLWARLKIYEAYKAGTISEKCAQYFDELLNKERFAEKIKSTQGSDTIYVQTELPNLIDVLYHIGSCGLGFNPAVYVSKATFKDGDKNVYLLNIVGENVNLRNSIYRFYSKTKYKGTKKDLDMFEEINSIKEFLEGTSYMGIEEKDKIALDEYISEVTCLLEDSLSY